ncbi:MAG TPA: xanthine dehydrogenase family protein molybdopterin-binding subunit [Nitrososphaerales archaeon]|nr:xanthine dehydrogenase family protein molybdopterin-binding subunit [Nitrososphaerales archaeon]
MSEQISQLLDSLRAKSERGELLYIGENVVRVDSLEKVLGNPVYTADLIPKGTVYAKLFHSSIPHGVIKRVELGAARSHPGVLGVLTAKDIPGLNESSAVLPDRQLFSDPIVRSTADILGAVIAETSPVAAEAAAKISVDYEKLPAVFDPLKALELGAVRVHEKGNIARQMKIRKGDVEEGFSKSDIILEKTYRTQFQDAAPLEPEVGLAIPEDGGVRVIGSMQSPHHTQAAVAKVLKLPPEKVRVIQAVTGGAFGPKSDETPFDVCSTAALAAVKFRRPVYCGMDREDSMVMHTKRHPFVISHKTGVSNDGMLLADESRIVGDTGAYASLGVFVIVRATFHTVGAYEIPNVKADSYLVYTNNTYTGSLRGFGGPQAIFAIESQMEELARKLRVDPLEFRLRNMLMPGKKSATSAVMDASCGLPQCVEKVVASSNYREKARRYRSQTGRVRRGLGIALLMHGNSLGPEGNDYGAVHIEVLSDGNISVGSGLTEYGTGAISGMMQVASSVLGVPLSRFRLERPDTSKHRESGPTVASRVVVIGGNASKLAAEKLRARIVPLAAEVLRVDPGSVAIADGVAFDRRNPSVTVQWDDLVAEAYRKGISLKEEGFFMAPAAPWDQEVGQGTPYVQYTWGALIIEVEVDMDTGYYKVVGAHAAYDVGKAVNPAGVLGQIYGGTVQGLGYAMMEELLHKEGVVMNPNLGDYYIPTSMDIPEEFKAFIVEVPGPLGPFGAKIIAEPPIVLPGAAVRNAVLNATGVSVDDLPVTSEKVLMGMKPEPAARSR